MRRALLLVAVVSLASTSLANSASGAAVPRSAPPLHVPAALAQALVQQGYPVRNACGSILEPPPAAGTHGRLLRLASVRACWLTIYKPGYSVSITPHGSPAAAKLAYQRLHNKWAGHTRRIAIGRFLVSAFRVSTADWDAITRTVSAASR